MAISQSEKSQYQYTMPTNEHTFAVDFSGTFNLVVNILALSIFSINVSTI